MWARQLLAFPLSSSPLLPWTSQPLMVNIVSTLNTVAALSPGPALELPFLATALAWIALLFVLATVIGCSYHRARHSSSAPVKVRFNCSSTTSVSFFEDRCSPCQLAGFPPLDGGDADDAPPRRVRHVQGSVV